MSAGGNRGGQVRLGIAGGREQDKSPLKHGVPGPRRDRHDAEASGLPTQPLAVAPARPRPPRLRFPLPREVVAPDLFLVVLVDEERPHTPGGGNAVVGRPDGEGRQEEVTPSTTGGPLARWLAMTDANGPDITSA